MLGSHQAIRPAEALSTAGITSGDYFGTAVAVADINGDEMSDLIVGVSDMFDGRVYILFLNADTTCVSFQKISQPSFTYYFGYSLAILPDMNGDSVIEMAVGAYGDHDGGSSAGAIYIFFLATDGTYNSYQKISDSYGEFTIDLANSDYFGSSVACLGDLNEDGIDDLAVGAYGNDDGSSDAGAVYILFLTNEGNCLSAQKISSESGNFTSTAYSYFGRATAGIGDLNSDMVSDVLVGAPTINKEGMIFVIFLLPSGAVLSHQKIGLNSGGFTAPLSSSDFFGTSCSSSNDINGDGLTDVMAGATGDDDGSENGGSLYVLFLDQYGWTISHQKISDISGDFTAEFWNGNDNGAQFGYACAFAGDMNGDGIADLIASAHATYDGGADENDLGTVYILFISQSFGTWLRPLCI